MNLETFEQIVIGTKIKEIIWGRWIKDSTDYTSIEAIVLDNGKAIYLNGSEQISVGEVWASIEEK